ncbi:alpha-L-rhamnosidase [Streptococcus oriscaviae]|uniref:alpha-L-rhamnosidase n=1 Tax=Streptococcus oriscaviae TaxID=2781599 RepID=A0ABX7YLC5_9STRE|nr:alpha-L-rhamnosidase [Streptococcus oriscaviae]QUE54039.1 family 78 glycoside hydrolase catalytic domain [Streptococcus oriscaviae]
MQIDQLKVNGVSTPLGYHFDYLTFSWRFQSSEFHEQLTFKIEISKDDCFEEIVFSGVTDSYYNTYTVTTEFLEPRIRYFWRVSVDEVSATSYFETGKMYEPWDADWISYEEPTIESVTFKKTFSAEKKISSARLYSLGLGLYEVFINKRKVGDEYLTPGYHSYDLIQQYQTYDVTEFLQDSNEVTFLVGNGWYRGRFVFEGGFENIYGDKQKLIAELHILYSDGSTEIIKSDTTWNAITNEIVENSIYDGEIIDFSSKCKPLTVIMDKASKQLLRERIDLPICNMESLEPYIFRDTANNLLLDFGQEITGWIEGVLPANKPKVVFKFGEILQDGQFYSENLRTAKQEFVILNNEKERIIRPRFTFFGFRYVKVEGLNEAEARRFSAKVLHSVLEERFEFSSSHRKLNQLISNIRWSQKDNFLSIPTDCPQRDERMGWTGDITVFANTASYNMETRAFLGHFLKMVELEQEQLNGAVPFFAPYPKLADKDAHNPFLKSAGSAVWGDAATVLPITLFRHFRDLGLLKSHLSMMMNWVDYIYHQDEKHGGKRLWDFGFQLGDWLALDLGIPGTVFGATDSALIATIYYYYSASNTAKALKLCNDSRASFYSKLALEIRTALLTTYFIGDELNLIPVTLQSEVELNRQEMGRLFGGIDISTRVDTQTGLSLLLRFGIYPSESARLKLVNKLKERMIESGGALTTGFVGTPELPHALFESELVSEAYSLLFRETSPSWLFEVNMGATTTWERWDSILPNGKISGIEMNSMNHYAYGAIEDFVIEKIIGINLPDINDNTNTYTISPRYPSQLDFLSGKLETVNGTIAVNWEIQNENVKLRIDVPARTNINLILLNGERKALRTGTYQFSDVIFRNDS